MKIPLRFLFTAGLGAAAMYYFDPDRGPRRRALLRDRLEDAGATESAENRARPKGSAESGRSPRPPKDGTPEQPDPVH